MFQKGGIYHVYNRGVDKREIFGKDSDYCRFLSCMGEFNTGQATGGLHIVKAKKIRFEASAGEGGSCPTAKALAVGQLPPSPALVSILAYCLLPNHFHLLLRDESDNGIPEFMKRLIGGYVQYYNLVHSRSGSLFQGKYKRKEVTSDHYLSYLASYINGNSEIHRICKASEWPYCSLKSFANNNDSKFAKPSIVYNLCDRPGQFWDFQNEVIRNALTVKEEYASLVLDDE